MKKTYLLIALILLSTLAYSFDGKRKGLLLGIGFSPAVLSLEEQNKNNYDEKVDGIKFATQTKIGWAFNERFELYLTDKAIWGNHKDLEGDKELFTTGFSGIGATYYLNESLNLDWSPSFYLTGGTGFSFWTNPTEDNPDELGGLGLFVGGGYEFAKHFSIEANLIYGNPRSEDKFHKVKFTGLSLSINACAF